MSAATLTATISVYTKQVSVSDMNVLDKLEIQQVGQTSHFKNATEFHHASRSALQGR